MPFLNEATIREMGVALGQKFTEGELNELGDLLRHAAKTCSEQMAFADRAAREAREHDSAPVEFELMAPEDIEEHAVAVRDTARSLRTLADAIEAGEKLGREDH